MPKKTQKVETRDELKAFLSKDSLVDQLIEQVFKVLDIDKTKSFTKDDLAMFLGFLQEECNLRLPEGAALETALIKRVGVKDLFKMNANQLGQTIKMLLDEQLAQLNRELGL